MSAVSWARRRESARTRAEARARVAAQALLAAAGPSAARVDTVRWARRAALRALPVVLDRRCDPAAAGSLIATFEVRVLASSAGPEVRCAMRFGGNGTVSVARARAGAPAPRAWVGATLGDLVLLAAGTTQWTEMLARGRLQMGGDPFMALRMPALLGFI